MLELEKVRVDKGAFRLSADLSIQTGARVAIIGPSGAGKSTLINAIAGFEPLASGAIRFKGSDIGVKEPGQRPIAILFQDQNLFPHLTLSQNAALGLNPNLRLSAQDHARVDHALDQVGLADFRKRLPANVSGGQQSRAALARMSLQARDIVLLDEPFAALGPALKADMLDLVASHCDRTNATLLMVSHDPTDALRLCPQSILVADNMARTPQDTRDLLDDPPPALRAYLGK